MDRALVVLKDGCAVKLRNTVKVCMLIVGSEFRATSSKLRIASKPRVRHE